MKKTILKAAVAALTVAALPSAAQAGTSTATSKASMTVVSQCTVAGATVSLGSFLSGNTWREVGNQLGIRGTGGRLGTLGTEYANYGSVTCANGVPYNLMITGSHTTAVAPGSAQFKIGTATAVFIPYVKKIGATVVPDNNWGGGGYGAYAGSTAAGNLPAAVGNGAAQAILGNFALYPEPSAAATGGTAAAFLDAKVGPVGSYSDKLNYTLNF